MEHDASYYDRKWIETIKGMPVGGQYRFDIRKHGYKLACDAIPEGSKVFDYACGLGVIDQMLIEKDCVVSGCDFSPVAVDYCKKETGGDFRVTGEIFGKHDVVIAAYFLEHIKDAWEWVEMALEHAPRVICHLPRNFSHHGEHIDMSWSSWPDFIEKFKQFDFIRLDTHDEKQIDTMNDNDIKYPKIGQFAHPIIEFRKKGGFDASKENKTISKREDKGTGKGKTRAQKSEEKEES
jgi:hypothetical protein